MIEKLKIKNFTLFEKADFSFGEKLNVIIGENGNGKTQILKLLYALTKSVYNYKVPDKKKQFEEDKSSFFIAANLENTFRAGLDELQSRDFPEDEFACRMIYKTVNGTRSKIDFVSFVKKHADFSEYFEQDGEIGNSEIVPLGQAPVYLPSRELLSFYPNFLPLAEKYDLPYDGTYSDTIKLLGLPYLNKIPETFEKIVTLLEEKLGGIIYLDPQGGRFYMKFNDGYKTSIDMTAEGWRKLGTLMQLLRVGALEKGSILFWDEPEANLNPRLICLICDIISTLSETGIQVFLTTHSLFLVNEIEIRVAAQKMTDGIRYFNFLPKGKVEQGNSFSALQNVVLLDESMKQADHYLNDEV